MVMKTKATNLSTLDVSENEVLLDSTVVVKLPMHTCIRITLIYLLSISYPPKITKDSIVGLNVINISSPDLGVSEQAEQVVNAILVGGKLESLINTTTKRTELVRFQCGKAILTQMCF